DPPASGWGPQAIDDGGALGRPQDHVECWDGDAAMGTTEQLPRPGVAALEHGLEPGHRCFALQPGGGGAGPVPPARGPPVARQMPLVVLSELTSVILLPTHGELGDVGHHSAAPLPAFAGTSKPPPVGCSPLR